MKPSVAIIGCGKVGTALGKNLSLCGYRVKGVASKNLASAQLLAEITGAEIVGTTPWHATIDAEIVLITTPDDVIETVCGQIAAQKGFADGAMVFHTSGALPSTILESARAQKAFIGSIHPLQSIASKQYETNPFQNSIMAVEGDAASVDQGRKIALDLGARPFLISTQSKTLYHAAAVVASNYLVALTDVAIQLLGACEINSSDAFDVLNPLITGTLENIKKMGPGNALTGPIARGDWETVNRHIDAIKTICPDLLACYKSNGRQTLSVVKREKNLSSEVIRKLTLLFMD